MEPKNEGKGKRRSKQQMLNLLRAFNNSQGITVKSFVSNTRSAKGPVTVPASAIVHQPNNQPVLLPCRYLYLQKPRQYCLLK